MRANLVVEMYVHMSCNEDGLQFQLQEAYLEGWLQSLSNHPFESPPPPLPHTHTFSMAGLPKFEIWRSSVFSPKCVEVYICTPCGHGETAGWVLLYASGRVIVKSLNLMHVILLKTPHGLVVGLIVAHYIC